MNKKFLKNLLNDSSDDINSDPQYFAEMSFEVIYDKKDSSIDFEEYYYKYVNCNTSQRRELIKQLNQLLSSNKIKKVYVPVNLETKYLNTKMSKVFSEYELSKDNKYLVFMKE